MNAHGFILTRPRKILLASTAVLVAFAVVLVARRFSAPPGSGAIPEVRPGKSAAMLTDWLVLGPFPSDAASPLVAHHLGQKGDDELTERDLRAAAMRGRPKHPAGGSNGPAETTVAERSAPEEGPASAVVHVEEYLRFSDHVGPAAGLPPDGAGGSEGAEAALTGDAYYAACVLRVLRPTTLHVMLASDSPLRLYLNAQLVAERTEARYFRRWDNSYRLRLKRGRNLLLVKLARTTVTEGAVALRLEPDLASATQTALENQGVAFSGQVVPDGKPFAVRVRGVPFNAPLTAEIFGPDGRKTRQVEGLGNRPVSFLPEADAKPNTLYTFRITHEGRTYEDRIVSGEPEAIAAGWFDRIARSSTNPQVVINVGALRRRWEILQAPEHRQPADREWQRKVVFVLTELEAISGSIQGSAAPFARTVGLHLRGFRSEIDGSLQYYRIYSPRRAEDPEVRVPLVVMLPAPVRVNRPFLESIFVAKHFEAEAMAALAERHGVALLWSGYRSRPTGAPGDLTHLAETMRAVEADYRIDPERIYVLGSCAGATFAMQAAQEWPRRFAGIGVLNPTFRVLEIGVKNPSIFQQPEYRAWRRATDPITNFIHQNKTPLAIVHDGVVDPGHGELDESVSFVAEARAGGRSPQFHALPPPPAAHFHVEGWNEVIEQLLEIRNGAHSPAPSRESADAVGPVGRALAQPFIVVEGTGGGEAERTRMRQTLQAFQSTWRELHSGECLTTLDRDLTDEQLRTKNLVLIGNPQTNAIWQRLAAGLEVTVAREGIAIDGQRFEGDALSLQAVTRHPLNPQLRLVLLGAGDAAAIDFGTLELSHAGWFDYAIWEATAQGPVLVTAKNYQPAPSGPVLPR